ncbi:hypothetical protein cypCar_00006475 [Cyprinus carpio]|nr:hypothetical protein cypCar_00006475 [Cyprinus carpio]
MCPRGSTLPTADSASIPISQLISSAVHILIPIIRAMFDKLTPLQWRCLGNSSLDASSGGHVTCRTGSGRRAQNLTSEP